MITIDNIKDIREFLKENKDKVFDLNIIKEFKHINSLNGEKIDELIILMKELEISKLVGPNDWFLDVEGNFYNEFINKNSKVYNYKDSNISNESVFYYQNTFLNPFYENYSGKPMSNSENSDNKEVNKCEEDKIKTLDQYIRRIGAFEEENKFSILWYRGQSSGSYNLLPSIYRKNGDKFKYSFLDEKKFLALFKSYATPFIRRLPYCDFEWLVYMQHYGLPTRLLDFTEDPLIALSFALQIEKENQTNENQTSKDAVVWVLNPLGLNQKEIGGIDNIPNISDMKESLKTNYRVDSEETTSRVPLACIGILNNERVISQKGTFLLYPKWKDNKVVSIDEMAIGSDILKRIIIDREAKDELRRRLRNMGYNHTKLYPSLESVAKDILYNYYYRQELEQVK